MAGHSNSKQCAAPVTKSEELPSLTFWRFPTKGQKQLVLRETIEKCPDDVWLNDEHKNSFWQVAYHALFFTHVYLQPSEAAFRYWKHSQKDVQNPDAFAIESDPNSNLPLLLKPYNKAEVLAYWSFCDQIVDRAVDALHLLSPHHIY